MSTNPPEILRYMPSHRKQVIQIWESSVRETHHFLLPEDIEFFKAIVEEIEFESFTMHCLISEGTLIGFSGVADAKLEMLFLDPSVCGRGFGRLLLRHAIEKLGVAYVDVNEQNWGARRFYEREGFEMFNRTETDSTGKPYPILQLRLHS